MKTYAAFIALALCSAVFSLWAGTIPNPGFEDWTVISYEDPAPFLSNNDWAYEDIQAVVVTKTTDKHEGSYAAKIETKAANNDTVFGLLQIGRFDDGSYSGGFPISEKPTALTGYYKCDVQEGDTALIAICFRKDGVLTDSNIYRYSLKFTGRQTSYTQFTIPLDLTVTPDTVLIASLSSRPFETSSGNWCMGIPGSVLYVDALSFSGVTAQPAGFNGGFENWIADSIVTLDDWNYDGSRPERTTDSYAGTYAVMLPTTERGGEPRSTRILLGRWDESLNRHVDGIPFTNKVDTLCGWYKFITAGQDTACTWIEFSKSSQHLAYRDIALPPVSAYTYFEMPFDLPQAPDSAVIALHSTLRDSNATIGSRLYVDKLSFKSGSISIKHTSALSSRPGKRLSIIYNAVTRNASVAWEKSTGSAYLQVYDLSGRAIYKRRTHGTSHIVPFIDFAPGFYTIELRTGNETRRAGLIHK